MSDQQNPEYSPVARSLYQPMPTNLHGSARWLYPEEAQQAGLFHLGGVALGQTSSGNVLSFHGDGHLLTFAPSGEGKGIGFVQPNLVLYPGSMIVLDPKGENVAVSARHRRDNLKQKVVVLDPFGESGKSSDCYNPLAPLSYLPTNELIGEVRSLTEALIPSRGGRDETHWINGARQFVEALLLFLLVHEPEQNRHLIRLHTLAFGSPIHLQNLFAAMQRGLDPDPEMARLCVALGNWWTGREEKERSYFLSIVHQELAWLGDMVWQKVLTGGTVISPKMERTTVYLVLPWKRLRAYRNWLRVMVASLLSQVITVPGRPDVPVLFLLDEAFLGLGRMEMILEAAAILRSEGGRIALVYQDILQLKSLYPDEWESFLANAGASLFWSVNDMTAARYISDRCGTETVPVPGSPTGHGRQLRQPNEVITSPKDEIYCFLRGLSPARFGRMDVRKDSRFHRFLDPNPKQRRVTPGRSLPGQQTARGYVPVDLNAMPAPQHGDTTTADNAEPIYMEDGREWRGEEKPLPPLPDTFTKEQKWVASRCAILAARYNERVYFEKGQFCYLDEIGFKKVIDDLD